MMSSLKSELRKLLSVRSTYIVVLAALALITLFNYFGTSASTYEEVVCAESGEVVASLDFTDERLKSAPPEEICNGQVNYNTVAIKELSKDKLLFNLQETIPVVSTFAAIIVVLLMAHEFRYNIINHTLTVSNSRSKVLLSKLVITSVFTLAVTLLAIGLTVVVTQIAVNVKDLVLPPQDYDWAYVVTRHAAFALANSLLFLAIITLVRNLTAGIAAIFLLPVVNALAMVLLTMRDIEPTKVLPLSALERFGSVATDLISVESSAEFVAPMSSGLASVVQAGLVVAVWLIGLWLVAWWSFLHRDVG